MEPTIMVFKVTDGQETWVYEDIEAALEHIRQGVIDPQHPPDAGDTFTIEIDYMTRQAIDALPVQ